MPDVAPIPGPRALSLAHRRGERTVAQTVEQVLAAIDSRGADAAWISIEPAAWLRERAAALDALPESARATLPLLGVPFAVKDNIDVAGRETTAACPAFAYTAQETAGCVQRLIDAGAVYVGKTNLDQFATGLVGVRSPYGIPVNTFDPSRVPGGSSSGSAVVVAAGLVSFALGTDTAGSGRVPAAFNNIVGLKPTRGRVSAHGVLPACRTLDCVAVFAPGCDDAGDVLAVISGEDARDAYSRAVPATLPPRARALAGARLGVLREEDREFDGDAQAAAAYQRAIATARALGAEIESIDYAPFAEAAALLYQGPWVAERYAAIRGFIEAQPGELHPVTRAITEGARAYSAVDAFEAAYRMQALRAQCARVWRAPAALDALLLPTAPTHYRLADLEADPIGPNTRLGRYTNFVNLLDLAAVAVPGGLREDGLPFGITLMAPAFHDERLLDLGARLQAALNRHAGARGLPVPAAGTQVEAAPPASFDLAVVGAHLSGMPLNGELTALGATLRRSAATAACYRLYALPGTSPARPGLVRVAQGGCSIALEVWSMSAEAFGRFVRTVPPPLSIGTLRLDDGSEVQGFLCETVALAGAEDVSAHGGWRAYCASRAGAR